LRIPEVGTLTAEVVQGSPQMSDLALQCDEYPFLGTLQGGRFARPIPHLKAINAAQNASQGGKYGNFVTRCGLQDRNPFLGIPLHPGTSITTKRLC
jgi:hypothetical protein